MAGLRDDPGLWLLLHLRPVGDRRHDGRGRCAVCGAEGFDVATDGESIEQVVVAMRPPV